MTLIRWRPSRDLMNIQDEMNQVFDRFFSKDSWSDGESVNQAGWYPVVDITENNDEYSLNVELPGLKKEDIHISFTDGVFLTLKAYIRHSSSLPPDMTNYDSSDKWVQPWCFPVS